MIYLGIDSNSFLIYEGKNMFGARALWPEPVLSPASFGLATESVLPDVQFDSWYAAKFVFREDAFDPVSRVRRGRFYIQHEGQPNSVDWYVLIAHPIMAHPSEIDENHPYLARKSVYTYQSYMLTTELKKTENEQLLVVLGHGDALTPWTVVNIETIHTGEELVTLKARQSLGVLPEMNWNKVPEANRAKVREELNRLENEFHKAGPESVVDRAREAAAAILKAWIWSNVPEEKRPTKKLNDLSPLIRFWEECHKINNGRGITCAAASIAYAAEIPQRFHSRGKHIEKERLNLRPLREQDAELAVQCIGTILCDLGWAKWR